MIGDVLGSLECPVCTSVLGVADQSLVCESNHRFDIARHGHVSLLARPTPGTGDTPDMVEAREAFLGAGHYRPISDAVGAAVRGVAANGIVVDVGGGAGHHLSSVVDEVPGRYGVVIDPSTAALRRAARRHPRITAIGGDVWQRLPIRSSSAAAVLSVFAPRNGPEMRRIMAADGRLVVVTPEPGHLGDLPASLRPVSIDPAKDARVERSLGTDFEAISRSTLSWTMILDAEEVAWLVRMGPNARHVTPETLAEATLAISPLTVTAAVTVAIWHPRP